MSLDVAYTMYIGARYEVYGLNTLRDINISLLHDPYEIVERLYFHFSLSVCVSVCLCVCLSVCQALLVNKIPAERMHGFGRGFC